MAELPASQRAYTLRIRGTSQDDHAWRDWLWKTHEAVNRGAKVFGDWLLTLRGGLDHHLAEEPVPSDEVIDKEWARLKKEAKAQPGNKKSTKLPAREAAIEVCHDRWLSQIRDRRIVLALSWLPRLISPSWLVGPRNRRMKRKAKWAPKALAPGPRNS